MWCFYDFRWLQTNARWHWQTHKRKNTVPVAREVRGSVPFVLDSLFYMISKVHKTCGAPLVSNVSNHYSFLHRCHWCQGQRESSSILRQFWLKKYIKYVKSEVNYLHSRISNRKFHPPLIAVVTFFLFPLHNAWSEGEESSDIEKTWRKEGWRGTCQPPTSKQELKKTASSGAISL